jgi:hypothetical protein
MSFWVHQNLDGDAWIRATLFSPPLPEPVLGQGYPTYFVDYGDVRLQFASIDELRVFVDTLGQRLLPTTRALSLARGTGLGPNSHWLSRLPAELKPWRKRQALTAYLRALLADLGVDTAAASRGAST